jgi:hypothetical protein
MPSGWAMEVPPDKAAAANVAAAAEAFGGASSSIGAGAADAAPRPPLLLYSQPSIVNRMMDQVSPWRTQPMMHRARL